MFSLSPHYDLWRKCSLDVHCTTSNKNLVEEKKANVEGRLDKGEKQPTN